MIDKDLRPHALALIRTFQAVLDEVPGEIARNRAEGLALLETVKTGFALLQRLHDRPEREGADDDQPADRLHEAIPVIEPSLKALHFIEAEEAALASEDTEHFSGMFLDCVGEVCGAVRYTDGDERQVMCHVSELFREAKRSGAAAIWAAHNHPGGDPQPSDADQMLTRTLQECCRRQYLHFLGHHIIPGDPRAMREAAAPILSDWAVRQAEHERLWRHTGGKPYWQR